MLERRVGNAYYIDLRNKTLKFDNMNQITLKNLKIGTKDVENPAKSNKNFQTPTKHTY